MSWETRWAQHQRNITWVAAQIRICNMARRLLRPYEQQDFWQLLWKADTSNRPELLPLRRLVMEDEEFKDYYRQRFVNYALALCSKIFDTRKWLYEARALRWKTEEYERSRHAHSTA